jgi:hypothetical protein
VEGHRYSDDESSWYSGPGQYAQSAGSYDSGIDRPSGAYRLPEPRNLPVPNQYPLSDPLTSTGSHPLPPDPEASGRVPRGSEYSTRSERRSSTDEPPPRPGENVYQTRRPVVSFLVAIVMIVLMLPVLRLLMTETFSADPTPRGIVPAVLLTLGFALSGVGLFAVARGGPISRDSWWRPPVAYLPAGLILLLAAGLAVA